MCNNNFLFTADDGVDIHIGQKIYYIPKGKQFGVTECDAFRVGKVQREYYMYFSTWDNAEKWSMSRL